MARYIDADALFKTVNRKFYSAFEVGSKDSENGRFRRGYNVAITDACEAITAAPTISPDEARGVGEWIWHDNYGWDDSIECSCCAEEFVVYDGEFPGIDSFKYCPNCGARMKGAEDGTTE